jgi:hypothetical protein
MSTYDELVDACEDFMLTRHSRFKGRNILNNNPDIDITYFNAPTFWYVCQYGYLEFAKQLFTIKKLKFFSICPGLGLRSVERYIEYHNKHIDDTMLLDNV